MSRFYASSAALQVIAHFEGVRLVAYRCPADVWTIGYGHTGALTRKPVRPNQRISLEEARALLEADVAIIEKGVSRLITGTATTQAQFDALVSFAFNLGLGALEHATLLKAHRANKPIDAAAQFSRWVYAGGQALKGLQRRRAVEALLYQGRVAQVLNLSPWPLSPLPNPSATEQQRASTARTRQNLKQDVEDVDKSLPFNTQAQSGVPIDTPTDTMSLLQTPANPEPTHKAQAAIIASLAMPEAIMKANSSVTTWKSPLRSLTLLGLSISFLGQLGLLTTTEVAELTGLLDQSITGFNAALSLLGLVMAAYGRYRAQGPLRARRNIPSPATATHADSKHKDASCLNF
jgi:lysozyme